MPRTDGAGALWAFVTAGGRAAGAFAWREHAGGVAAGGVITFVGSTGSVTLSVRQLFAAIAEAAGAGLRWDHVIADTSGSAALTVLKATDQAVRFLTFDTRATTGAARTFGVWERAEVCNGTVESFGEHTAVDVTGGLGGDVAHAFRAASAGHFDRATLVDLCARASRGEAAS